MSDLLPITLDEQVACVQREIGFRRRVYAAWVHDGRMSQKKATHELRAMEAVLNSLTQLKGLKVH